MCSLKCFLDIKMEMSSRLEVNMYNYGFRGEV